MINKKHVEQIEKNIVAGSKFVITFADNDNDTLKDIFNKKGMHLISDLRQQGLKCINCSTDITGPILNFFKFDVTKVLCYDCQKINKPL